MFLKALGQVMLNVDGMNGVMEHNETVKWLYSLTASKFCLVVKTALKLLLVFWSMWKPTASSSKQFTLLTQLMVRSTAYLLLW
jgi:hypothetical protein